MVVSKESVDRVDSTIYSGTSIGGGGGVYP